MCQLLVFYVFLLDPRRHRLSMIIDVKFIMALGFWSIIKHYSESYHTSVTGFQPVDLLLLYTTADELLILGQFVTKGW